jgi:hypothetical protein
VCGFMGSPAPADYLQGIALVQQSRHKYRVLPPWCVFCLYAWWGRAMPP